MGLIICENHGEKGIVQMSKVLHNYYIKNEKTEVFKITYEIEGLDNFIHYFSGEENLDKSLQINDIEDFEDFFPEISGDPGACIKCFKSYLNENNIKIIDKVIKISNITN